MLSLDAIEIRNLEDGDAFRGADNEFPFGWQFDKDWVWVAVKEYDGEQYRESMTVAGIIASPCHGVVLIHRVWVSQGHGRILLPLLRRVIHDCTRRGFRGYMSQVNVAKKEQLQLLRIAMKAGAQVVTQALICFGGKLEDASRW